HPVGHTDSERAFCCLLEIIARSGKHLDNEASWQMLHAALLELNAHGKLNCLLSDGRRLFVYRDANGHKGLWRREIHPQDDSHEDDEKKFQDNELRIQIEKPSLSSGWIVATCPLSGEDWQSLDNGELMVLEKGVLRFSSAPSPSAPRGYPGLG